MMLTILQVTGRSRQILISSCMYLGQLIVGFSVAWSGPILLKLRDHDQITLGEKLSDAQSSLIASLLYVGCIIALYLVGWLSNSKGRKLCFILGGLIATMAYVLLATTTNLAMLYCGRILSGIGIGIIALMNLVYIGELASTNIRGILLTILGIFGTCGAIVLYSAACFFTFFGINNVGLVLSLTFTLAALVIPESPMFYVIKGKDEATIKTLQNLGRSEDIDNYLAAKKDYRESNAKKDWIELFKLPSNRKALAIISIVNILQHCSGVMVLIFYTGLIFEIAGSPIEPNICMLIVSTFQLTGSCISPILVERNGRKILLAVSSAICSLAMLLLGFYFYLDHIGNPIVEYIKWFPLVSLVIFFIGYDIGLGIIPNTLIGEMFITSVRSHGSSVALTVTWIVGFLIITLFGSFVDVTNGYIAFWIFSGICCCSVIFTIFCVLETKGRTLLEIQELLGK